MTSSYFDQIEYTLLPSAPPFLLSSFKYSDGSDKGVAPGKNPSLILHAGKALAVQHDVNPKFPHGGKMTPYLEKLNVGD